MKPWSPIPTRTLAVLAVWLALVLPSCRAIVGSDQGAGRASSDPCVDQSDGKPITSGVCNKPLVIGLSISLFFVLVLVLAVLVWFKFRRRKNDAKMMAELGIDTMRSPSRDSRETTKTVIVKLPALSVPIPPGKVAGEVPRSPDSIVTPASFHVGQ